ncbi:MAG: hypothetical protein HY816_12865 [Candidatus Wallbacteria bacterium]|nr:hypothetical protein [Candidatus Wallbacteria bacterium]
MHSFGSRRGFLMWTVLGILAVMGILAFALNYMARQQNAMAHRVYFGEVAQHLAQGGLELMGRRVRDTLYIRRLPRANARPEDGSFFSAFLLDNERLKKFFDSFGFRQEEWFQQLFGKDYRYPLDVLVKQVRGSSLRISLAVDPQPLCKDPIVVDAVEKRVRLVLRSRGEYRGVVRELSTGYEVKVVHPFPPVASKFTLFAHEAEPGQGYNTFRNDTSGMPYTPNDFPPVVFDNTPPEEVQDRTLIAENLPNEQTAPFAQMGQVRTALERRGWIYLGTGTGSREVHLNMTAGPVLVGAKGYGEYFHLFDPLPEATGGFDAKPAYFAVMQPPAFFEQPVADLVHPGVQQKPNINFLYWAFHYPDASSNLRDGTLGGSLQTESSSVLHLYGTHANPSRTKVFGNVFQDYIRFGYLALDRDTSNTDEDLQRANLAAAGLPPHVRVRDTIDPVFKYATEEEYTDDLRAESAGQPRMTLSTIPPEVVNKNFVIDGVMADPGWPTVPLDLGTYRYARMFDGIYDSGESDPARNRGYSRYMSQVEAVPYNEMLDYMFYGGVIPPQSNPLYQGPTLPEGNEFYQQADQVAIDFHDPLHDELRRTGYFQGALRSVFQPGSASYSESIGTTEAARAGLRPPDVKSPSPASTLLLARTYAEYRTPSDFMAEHYNAAANILELHRSVRIRQGDLVLPPNMRYVGSGMILLMNGSITSQGQVPLADPSSAMESTLTLATLDGDVLLGPGAHQAAFIAPAGALRPLNGLPLGLEGTAAARIVPPSSLTAGGQLVYRGVYDPATDLREPRGSAYIDYYQIAMEDSPMDWSRITP